MNNVANTNLPLTNVHENKAKYVHMIERVCRSESCLYTGGNGPTSLFRVEGCF